jgi:RNA polymerase sigma factor (sigma-70 family)
MCLMHGDDVEKLVSRCLERDQRAWSALIDRYAGLVYAIARGHRLSAEACDDVAQTVFANLARSLGQVREPAALAAWLSSATRRECWKVVRTRQRERAKLQGLAGERGLDASGEQSHEMDGQAVEGVERAHALAMAMKELGERCRELLRALFGSTSEPDYAQISANLGLPIGSIGPTRQRCLAKLAQLLSEAKGRAKLTLPGDETDPAARWTRT